MNSTTANPASVLEYSFARNTKLLRHKVSKYAVLGLLISLASLIIASALAAYITAGEITIETILLVQKTNPALWILNLTPFLFSFWGQYVSDVLAYEASKMVVDQTTQLQIREKVLEAQVLHESMHDTLTDLPNRILFFDRLIQAISNNKEHNAKCAVCILDIINFKDINDSLSFYDGDRLLEQIAERLKATIVPPNTLARLSGDDFAILLPKISSLDEVTAVAQLLQKQFESPYKLNSVALKPRVGIGIAIFPDHGEDVETLMQRAEFATSVAKQRKLDFVVYSPEYDQRASNQRFLLSDLQGAIAANQLQLFYQPQVDMKTNEMRFVEGLVRWNHPTQGLVEPDDFIPYAERSGVIRKISQWVIEESMRQCKDWRTAGFQIGVSINLSPIDLLNVNLVNDIKEVLNKYQAKPEWLVIEITENALMVDQELGRKILLELSQLGVQIAIDDFGTGYSSLSKLSKMPANILKIDKSFVMNMLKSKGDEVIVRTVIDLAHNLGIVSIAEGAADQAIFEKLLELSCDIAQGFHISRPIPAEELQALLAELTPQ